MQHGEVGQSWRHSIMALSGAASDGRSLIGHQNLNTVVPLLVEHFVREHTPPIVDSRDSIAIAALEEINSGIWYSFSKGLHLATAITLQEEEESRANSVDSSEQRQQL